jgi:hypothetical protein
LDVYLLKMSTTFWANFFVIFWDIRAFFLLILCEST